MNSSLSQIIQGRLKEGQKILQDFLSQTQQSKTLSKMAEHLAQVFDNDGKVLTCGNGGSACDALHFAEEFTGNFNKQRKALPVISLLESSHLTCVGNDFGFNKIFSRGVEAYGKKGDVLLALSTSGNSPNILEAVKEAQKREMSVYLFMGRTGGKLKGQADFEILVPADTSDRIQEVHMMCLHILIESVERILFPEHY